MLPMKLLNQWHDFFSRSSKNDLFRNGALTTEKLESTLNT